MKIKQRKSRYLHTFTFKDHTLNYAYKHSGGSGDYDIQYADFPSKSITYIEINEWCRSVGWLWILLGIGHNVYRFYTMHLLDKMGTLFIILGIVCLVWVYLRKVKFTIFQTPQADVLVIKNRKHDKIISEIQSRRKDQLLDLYGSIDFENNIENEIKKFEWLKDENILSDIEANEKILKLQNSSKERIGFIQ